tara:strand:- start:2986 stop:3837 length:852 start_codon:yes stop_codon:yes gene_type:complete
MEFVKLVGPFGTIFIMFALGLNLTLSDFTKVLKKPNNLIVGLFSQLLILPLIGLLFVKAYPMREEFQLGVFLLLTLPSAVMSNYATKLVHGNVALSIILTSLCALFSFITIPIFLSLFSIFIFEGNFEVDLLTFSLKLFFFMSFPTFLGVLLRSKYPKYISTKTFALDRAALFLFLFIIFYAIYTERFNLRSYFEDTGGISFIIVFLILVLVFTVTDLFIEDIGSKRAIRIEALLQNGAMGIVVGAQIFDKIAYITPIAIYALVQYIVLMFYIGNINISKKSK